MPVDAIEWGRASSVRLQVSQAETLLVLLSVQTGFPCCYASTWLLFTCGSHVILQGTRNPEPFRAWRTTQSQVFCGSVYGAPTFKRRSQLALGLRAMLWCNWPRALMSLRLPQAVRLVISIRKVPSSYLDLRHGIRSEDYTGSLPLQGTK
jgi:hypothetical protein